MKQLLKRLLTRERAIVLGTTLAVAGAAAFLAPSVIALTAPFEPTQAMAAPAADANGPIEVMHFWNSGSEREALNVFREAYIGRGGDWIDSALPDHSGLRHNLINRLSTGTPPSAVLWQSNIELRDLAELGLFVTLDDVAARENWDAALAPAVRARVQVDGHYYMAPTNIHGLNWIFYNKALVASVGFDELRTWDDILTAMHRVEASGRRAVAIGGDDWETLIAFGSVMVSVLGRENYRRLIADADVSVLDLPEAREAFRVFGEIRDMAHRRAPYDNWAEASHAVTRGEAAFEFMGDWAKGEIIRAGGEPGADVGCMLAPGGEDALILTIDGFAFPAGTGSATAHQALAALFVDPQIQRRFAVVKGTLPARSDAAPAVPDRCEAIIIDRLRDPRAPVEPFNAGLPAAMAGDWQIAAARFYHDRTMTPEQGVALLRTVYSN